MPKFLQLFRRKSKANDPAAAGILSPSANPSTSTSTGPQPKQKKQKKLSYRQLKKQKKKDKLAHFPSSNKGGGGGGSNLLGENNGGIHNSNNNINGAGGAGIGGSSSAAGSAVPAVPGWETPEEQKENSGPAGMTMRPAIRASAPPPPPPPPPQRRFEPPVISIPGDDDDAVVDDAADSSPSHEEYADSTHFYNDDIYEKPALSIIDEEKSPKNASLASPTSAASGASSRDFGDGSGAEGADGAGTGGMHPHAADAGQYNHNHGGEPPQAATNPLVSPMSGNKPPLTPNRLGGHRGSSSSNGGLPNGDGPNLAPGQFRSPNGLPGRRDSPNNKLNGMTIDTNAGDANNSRHSMSSEDQSLRGMHIAGAMSEDMCLSPDEEDDEYNRLAGRKEVATPSNSAALGGKEKFVSALDRSPFSYTSEEDGNALFPALVEDKDPWQGGHPHHGGHSNHAAGGGPTSTKSSKSAPAGSKNLSILPMAHETQEDIRAWTPSPTKKNSFTFQGGDKNVGHHPHGGGTNHTNHGSHGANRNNAGDNVNAGGHPKPIFENFADFEPFDPAGSGNAQPAHGSGRYHHSKQRSHGSSKSVHGGSSPVSSLLEESRARRKGHRSIEGGSPSNNFLPRSVGGGGGDRGGSSINSAPVLTPSHIRGQVHSSRTHKGGDSISRVIDNLELHVNKRRGHAANSSVDSLSRMSQRSGSDAGVGADTAAVRDAKARIRRENMMHSESKMIDMLAAGGPGAVSAANAANAANATPRGNGHDGKGDWLFDEVTDTLGPPSAAADLESIDGRSHRSGRSLGGKSHRSSKSHRSHRSKKSRSEKSRGGHRRHRSSRHVDDGVSVDSRTSRNSRNSYRSYQTTKSMVSQMSEQSRSVANDLLRLEAQLSMVGKTRNGGANNASGERPGGAGGSGGSSGPPIPAGIGGGASVVSRTELHKRRDDCGMTVASHDFSISRSSAGGLPRRRHHGKSSSSSGGSRNHISSSARRAAARTLRSKVTVIAPPGKLGIILANRTDSRGTVVSGVRTSSVLAEQVSPGDRIIAIDEEDVSQMNVKEITTIMARKSEFERALVLLAAPKVTYD